MRYTCNSSNASIYVLIVICCDCVPLNLNFFRRSLGRRRRRRRRRRRSMGPRGSGPFARLARWPLGAAGEVRPLGTVSTVQLPQLGSATCRRYCDFTLSTLQNNLVSKKIQKIYKLETWENLGLVNEKKMSVLCVRYKVYFFDIQQNYCPSSLCYLYKAC